jgi:hypothetical protein
VDVVIVSFQNHPWAIERPERDPIIVKEEASSITPVNPSGSRSEISSINVSFLMRAVDSTWVALCNRGLLTKFAIVIRAAKRATLQVSNPAKRDGKKLRPAARSEI